MVWLSVKTRTAAPRMTDERTLAFCDNVPEQVTVRISLSLSPTNSLFLPRSTRRSVWRNQGAYAVLVERVVGGLFTIVAMYGAVRWYERAKRK